MKKQFGIVKNKHMWLKDLSLSSFQYLSPAEGIDEL